MQTKPIGLPQRLSLVLAVLPAVLCIAALAYAQVFDLHMMDSASETGAVPAAVAEPNYMDSIFAFMLASFIGVYLIRHVSRLLHTPLMSLTNAISAIAVVGAIMVAGSSHYPTWIRIIGVVALFASTTNIVSGFLITNRMLKMFKSREGGQP